MRILKTLILLIWLPSFGQNEESVAEKLFRNGESSYEIYNAGGEKLMPIENDSLAVNKGEIDDFYFRKAYESFKKIVENYPQSKDYNYSLFYLGHFEFVELKYEQSKKHLLEFIQNSSSGYEKRLAYFDLAEIAISNKDITQTQKYLELISSQKPKFLCGNAQEDDLTREKHIIEEAKKLE
jgi:tetratricopeptide (TPR) repeat protein